MRILYVAQLAPFDSALFRAMALRREGHDVTTVNTLDYLNSNALMQKLEFRAVMGPGISRLNKDILAMAKQLQPDIVWADKVLGMRPQTLQTLRSWGIVTVSYMIDNFFGPRRDPGWRLYAKTIPDYDLHCTQRDVNMRDYMAAGARNVIKIQTAYEPTVHFPPPALWSDEDRNRDVSFIGTPYDQRPTFLTQLWRECGFAVQVNGSVIWKPALAAVGGQQIYNGSGELRNADYREGIWRSRINLSFLTHSNQDEFVHKSFEIAACGGFLLAERSAGHKLRFEEDVEAVFFEGLDECAAKIRQYLKDEGGRASIAAAGQRRATTSGYDNDTQIRQIIERVRTLIASRPSRAGTGKAE
ncbi:CgeB family protein [Terriglobus roseus]|uniref:Glycosyl transferases group 1 n=1 Tax=Terriglobus roseus TaxID=392734 RepID=A0A1H4JKD9_9BACT|nr:glycosyltransferase [Terriglobus roseus]SEB46790.1 Glycosyl transferases group 1 [Terriglobus roseus]